MLWFSMLPADVQTLVDPHIIVDNLPNSRSDAQPKAGDDQTPGAIQPAFDGRIQELTPQLNT